MKQNNMLAMILAGGRGSRLHDLTNKVAKPAVSYGGKYRIVDFPLSNCANSGIDVVAFLPNMNLFYLTVMSQPAGAGGLTPETVVYLYFLHAKKQMPTWMFTVVQQMLFPRTLTSLILTHQNTFLFFRETTFTR